MNTDGAMDADIERHDFIVRIAICVSAAIIFGCAVCFGCRTATPDPRIIVLSEHCQTAAPGDTVPPLPDGETRWWLCTPTGLRMMMPADCDFPDVPEKEGESK